MMSGVGIFFDYFVAPDDETAAAVIDWPGGPASGLDESGPAGKRSAGLPTLQDTGVEPTVALGMLQEMLTGKRFDEQLADSTSRPILANRDGGECLVLRLGDDLVGPLAQTPTEHLRELAQPWAQIEEFWGQGDPSHLSEFLTELQQMSKSAQSLQHGVYCWICL
jgi:hypothetical protein